MTAPRPANDPDDVRLRTAITPVGTTLIATLSRIPVARTRTHVRPTAAPVAAPVAFTVVCADDASNDGAGASATTFPLTSTVRTRSGATPPTKRVVSAGA